MRLSLIPLVAAVAFSGFGQETAHVEPPVYVTAIDIVADVRDSEGKLPRGLTAEDFIVIEEGVERPVIGLVYLRAQPPAATPEVPAATPVVSTQPLLKVASAERAEWQIVLYFETQLSSRASRKRAADALMKQADELVSMGRVDIVFSDPRPTALVRDSRDAEAIRVALRKIIARGGMNKLVAHRRDFYTTVVMGVSPQGIGTIPLDVVRPYVDEEIGLITRFRTNLIGWLSTYGNHIPRTLLMVNDGFDLDPLEFYAANMTPSQQITLRSYVQQSHLGVSMEQTTRTLAAGGWTTVSIPGETNSGNWVDDASVSAVGRVRAFNRTNPTVAGPKAFVYRPREPLTAMAEATGGAVVPNAGKLDDAIARLGERVKLTYQVARPPDGKARGVEVRSRQKSLKVRTVKWAASSRPDQMAEARALGLLKGDAPAGDLQIESRVEWDLNPRRKKGMVFLTTNLDPVARIVPEAGRGPFRVTFAVHAPPDSAFVVNRLITDQDPTADSFKYRTPIEVPLTATLIVITVEEINTGLWGSSRVEVR